MMVLIITPISNSSDTDKNTMLRLIKVLDYTSEQVITLLVDVYLPTYQDPNQ